MIYIATLGILSFSVFLLWRIPRLQAEMIAAPVTPLQRAQAINEFRRTIAQILGGLFLLVGLYYTSRQLHATQEGQITDRFSRAILQLGTLDDDASPLIEVRQGGIYSLERVARDSRRDHGPIMEVLTAYVRNHARNTHLMPQQIPFTTVEVGAEPVTVNLVLEVTQPIRQDIQSALTVIGRRRHQYDDADRNLDLSKTDLHDADLGKAILGGVMLRYSNLRSANLVGANLADANLNYVDLQRANLSRAVLRGATMEHALLQQAILIGTDLREVDLRTVLGLTNAQLADSLIDEDTRLPVYLTGDSTSGNG